ncbi:MAG: MBL fold metallo-hydrolase [Burkholderiaceae bacterium]|nr:MBL fold metallo-hydrolase [Burkholderiaceae bacterium]
MNTSRILRAGVLAIAAAFAAGVAAPGVALAEAPMVKASAPGYYRTMVGDFEVTALSDGTTELPADKILGNIKPAEVGTVLAKSYLKTPLETSFNGFLVNTGGKLVLIDTGAGKFFGPTLGNLLNSLKAAGYQPEQVDEVYITHMHGDHIGGLLADGKAAFPNAVVRMDKRESDYWLSKENMDKAPADRKGGFENAQAALAPYIQAGKFKPFEGSVELVPGVKSESTYGHTPGHTSYAVESKGQKMVVWGDLIHVASVQLGHPDVLMNFDSDTKAGLAMRHKVYAEAAKEGYIVAGAHISFPGLGRLRAEGKGYVWVPVNYSVVRN